MTDDELTATLRGSIAEIREQPDATPVAIAAFLWHCIANAYEDRPNPEKILQLVRCSVRAYNEIYLTKDKYRKRRRS